MFLPVVLILIASVATQDGVDTELCTTCVELNGTCYNNSYLYTLKATFGKAVVVPKMGILHADNILFYSFEPIIEDPEYYKVAYVSLDNPENETVLTDDHNHIRILNFKTFDIDQVNSYVYLGGSDGIFKYDKQKLTPYSSRGDTIKSLFYKANVYFVDHEDFVIKAIKNNRIYYVLILDDNILIKAFVITKDDVIVCLSNQGLFLRNKNETVLLSSYPFYRGLTMDLDGVIYVWWLDEIYKVVIYSELSKSRLINLSKIKNLIGLEPIGAITFDKNNNIIFNVGRRLYRMTKTNMNNC